MAIELKNVTAYTLAADSTLVTKLQSILSTTVYALHYNNVNQTSNANITIASVNTATGVPVPGSTTVAALNALFLSTSCTLNFATDCLSAALGYNVSSVEVTQAVSGLPPLPSNYTSITGDVSAQAVAALLTLANFWLDLIQPAGIPFDQLNAVFLMAYNNTPLSLSAQQTPMINYTMPYLCLLAFCLLCAFLFPIVLLFICCCRTCQCCCCHVGCGGERLAHHPNSCQRTTLIIIGLILATLMALTAIGILLGDKQITAGKTELHASLINAVGNLVEFKNNTINQTEAIVGPQYETMVSNVVLVMNTIASERANLVQATLTSATTIIINDIATIAASVTDNLNNLNAIQSDITTIKNDLTTLTNDLSTFHTESVNNQNDCNTLVSSTTPAHQAQLQAICNLYPTTAITINVNYNSLPDLSPYISQLQSVSSGNLGGFTTTIQNTLNTLNTTIINVVNNATTVVSNQMESFHTTLLNQFNPAVDTVNNNFDKLINPNSIDKTINVSD